MFLLKLVLSKTSQKPAPMRIPLTGARTEGQDYYSVSLNFVNQQLPDLLVRKSGRRGVACRVWDGERYSRGRIVPWEELEEASIEIRHYLDGNEFRYDSLFSFLWQDFFRLPKIAILKNKIVQKVYNSRTPVRTSMVTLLKLLIQRRVDALAESNAYVLNNESGDSILDLLQTIYGTRIYQHPQYNDYRARLLVDLDSLVESGDVRALNSHYIATGNAVSTIATYEEQNRRHIDNKKHNNRILWLTIALVGVGVLQIPWVQSILGIGGSQ